MSQDDAEAHNIRGNALRALGQHEAALTSYDTAIALRPDYAEAHYNRGNALADLGNNAAALASYDTAIALRPDYAQAHANRGNVLSDLGRCEAALASYDQAIALRPDHALAHYNRGNVLLDLGHAEAALESYRKAIALRPDMAAAHANLGIALSDLWRHAEALASFDAAIALNPDLAEAHYNRGKALGELGRYEAALASHDKAIALRPDYGEALWNQTLCLLQLGRFERGWRQFEYRHQFAKQIVDRRYPQPVWLGQEDIAGKTLFIYWEQGFGDTLQFCRYVGLVKALGAQVILAVQDPLVRLLQQTDPAIRVIGGYERPAAFDCHCPLMSLPLAMGTTVETIPATIPYLRADPERSAAWRGRLAALPGLKVGLVWAGAPRPWDPEFRTVDRRRSMTLNHFAPLAGVPGICLISLQKGEPAAQARTPPEGMVLHDWTEELDDFADTAALVEALDLVISVDTAVLHVAGGLGKPVWVLNRHDQCWRWLTGRRDSPWYPTVRLFRQPAMGDWDAVVDQVRNELSGVIEGGAAA